MKELLYTVGDSDPSLIIIHPSFEEKGAALREQVSSVPFMTLTPFTAQDSAASISLPPFHPSCPLSRRALMIYTSGTTSNPKGCVTTHQNITFQADCLVKAWQYTPADHLIHVLPLHHVHGIINGLTATLLAGATVEMHPRFDAQTTWSRWQDVGSSTMFFAVPTIYSKLVDYFDAHIRATDAEAAAREGARALRLVVSGSAALPTPIRDRFLEITGQTLLERYGMTEIGMAISCGLELERRIDGSVGWPLPGVQVRLVDKDTGRVIDAPDEDGIIEVKGDNVFLEYWRRPEATAREFSPDGWFRTGDVARRRASDGAYFIQGRASVDLIKSGGYKISALEVERKMLALDAVQEVAVVGLADEEWGQRVAAVVKQRPGVSILLFFFFFLLFPSLYIYIQDMSWLTGFADGTPGPPDPPRPAQGGDGAVQDPDRAQGRRRHRAQRHGQGQQEGPRQDVLAGQGAAVAVACGRWPDRARRRHDHVWCDLLFYLRIHVM